MESCLTIARQRLVWTLVIRRFFTGLCQRETDKSQPRVNHILFSSLSLSLSLNLVVLTVLFLPARPMAAAARTTFATARPWVPLP